MLSIVKHGWKKLAEQEVLYEQLKLISCTTSTIKDCSIVDNYVKDVKGESKFVLFSLFTD